MPKPEPNLLKETFPFDQVPKIQDDNNYSLLYNDIWLTDTTLRDGQQARGPYTVEQAVQIFKFLNQLGGNYGLIRQTELFLYTDRDIKVLNALRALDLKYPEITAWIRATESDVELAAKHEFKEAGVLTSVSDFHIFYKFKKSRDQIWEHYLKIVNMIIDKGMIPRCHLEDCTRSDIPGFTKPYLEALNTISENRGVPIKIRICDTMGVGLPYNKTCLPRSVKEVVKTVRDAGFKPEQIEWHGHNDFHKGFVNGVTAWLNGCSVINGTLLGFGERTGNPPLEGLCVELAGLKRRDSGLQLDLIPKIADYFKNELKYDVAENYPFAGEHCTTTRAGIHIDGTMKNEHIYNIFDTTKIIGKPPKIQITDKSGAAGVALWIEQNMGQKTAKNSVLAAKVLELINKEYETDRTTPITTHEMKEFVNAVKTAFQKYVK